MADIQSLVFSWPSFLFLFLCFCCRCSNISRASEVWNRCLLRLQALHPHRLPKVLHQPRAEDGAEHEGAGPSQDQIVATGRNSGDHSKGWGRGILMDHWYISSCNSQTCGSLLKHLGCHWALMVGAGAANGITSRGWHSVFILQSERKRLIAACIMRMKWFYLFPSEVWLSLDGAGIQNNSITPV